MERPGVPQVTEGEAREIRGSFRDLFVTLRETFGPPAIQLRRRDEATGNFANAGLPFTPESITLPNRQEQVSGQNTGLVSADHAGKMQVKATIDIRRADRFQVDGVTCVVTFVPPEVNAIGYRAVDFMVEG
jgi:hypothetical protein